jgi:hypothetical protein
MSPAEAKRFRLRFDGARQYFNVTYAEIGPAFDAHPELRPTVRGEGSGAKTVYNAMMRGRILTHRVARALVVGLFLADRLREPAIEREAKHRKLTKEESESAVIMVLDAERAALGKLVAFLARTGALSLTRPAEIPAFIPLAAVAPLARGLAAAAARAQNVGKATQRGLARWLERELRKRAPLMGRAWGDSAQQMFTTPGARPNELVETLLRAGLSEAYVYPSQGPSWGREFELLARERPELVDPLEIPLEEEHQK